MTHTPEFCPVLRTRFIHNFMYFKVSALFSPWRSAVSLLPRQNFNSPTGSPEVDSLYHYFFHWSSSGYVRPRPRQTNPKPHRSADPPWRPSRVRCCGGPWRQQLCVGRSSAEEDWHEAGSWRRLSAGTRCPGPGPGTGFPGPGLTESAGTAESSLSSKCRSVVAGTGFWMTE